MCDLVLAPSSIPGAGFGVFTIRDISKGSLVGSPEIGIPFVDRSFHTRADRNMKLGDYIWDGTDTYESNEVEMLVPGLGMMTNFHPALVNLDAGYGKYDDRLLSQSSPNTGAVTYYADYNMTASRDIVAGEELFSDYGEQWFHTRPHAHEATPLLQDYKDADIIMKDISNLLNNLSGYSFDSESESKRHILDDVIITTMKQIASRLDVKTGSLLPGNKTSLQEKRINGSARSSVSSRSVTWLQEHGKCFDNVFVKESSIYDSGRGVFARRSIRKNQSIIPTPVMPMLREDFLMYKKEFDDDGQEVHHSNIVIGNQLLLNYCFGNAATSLVLCPSSHVASMNHRSVDEGGSNARIQWSTWPINEMQKLANMTVSELVDSVESLVIDVVATSDIQPNEEIFLDYGKQWEDQWKRHILSRWTPSRSRGTNISIAQFNEVLHSSNDTMILKNRSIYPKIAMMICAIDMDDITQQESTLEQSHMINGSKYDTSLSSQLTFWPCDVLHKDKMGSYTVVIKLPDGEQKTVVSLPKMSIKAVNKQGQSDQFIKNSFRELIGIPTNILPLLWQDLATS